MIRFLVATLNKEKTKPKKPKGNMRTLKIILAPKDIND